MFTIFCYNCSDAMNNSCDLKLIQACHEEIEHRVKVYEKHKNPNMEVEGAGNNLQNYETPWIDPSTQESIYADPLRKDP